jgi:hypothetical protein
MNTDLSGFGPGAIVEFPHAGDPSHDQGERGRILLKDHNGDFHIQWNEAGVEVWRVAEAEKELRLVSPAGKD